MQGGTVRLGGEAVRVTGLKELRAVLRQMTDTALLKELAKINEQLAQRVISRARATASGAMQHSAAGRLKASKSQAAARITLGGKPYDFGAEFGAKRNQRRLLKNTRGRATIVRDDEDIDRVTRRVEAQTVAVDRFGGVSPVRKRTRGQGGIAVKVTRSMLGWNQFEPWRGNGEGAGYFLFPAIRSSREEIIEAYLDEIERIWMQEAA